MGNNTTERISKKLKEDMKVLMELRVKNNLMKLDDAKMPKMTELLTRTQGYQISLTELKTKPEKKKNEF